MRILLFTGKGGVGKTSLAAATALATAKRGYRTLILSTDPAHSLGDALDLPLGGEPRKIAPQLFAMEVDTAARFEEFYGDIQKYLVRLFAHFHIDEVVAEELSIFPGMDELLSLAEVYRESQKKRFQVIIIDTAPTGNTLRLLSFPEIAGWYGRKILPVERKIARLAKPFVNRLARLPFVPEDELYQNIRELIEKIEALHALLTNPAISSIRLVLQPEKIIIKETQRAYTSLLLFGFPVDACLVNRILPPESGSYFAQWATLQEKYLKEIQAIFSPLPIFKAPYYSEEMVGLPALENLSHDLYGNTDPASIFFKEKPFTHKKRGKDKGEITLKLPQLEEEPELFQSGEEIVICWKGLKHHILLPESMRQFALDSYERKNAYLHIYLKKKEIWEYS